MRLEQRPWLSLCGFGAGTALQSCARLKLRGWAGCWVWAAMDRSVTLNEAAAFSQGEAKRDTQL